MGPIEWFVESLHLLSPAQYCQAFYVLCTATVLFIHALPNDLRNVLLEYGPRQQNPARQNKLAALIDSVQVPHSWFLHFYLASFGLSLFWAWQYHTQGEYLTRIAQAQVNTQSVGRSMDISQVFIAWGMMTAQGGRRLYESLFVTKAGKSPMSGVHWVVGLAYYAVMSVTIWIEGSGAILKSWEVEELVRNPPTTLPLGVGLFMMGWLKQRECHAHLASLKKYTLPSEGWFEKIICPHYTSECLIYLGIAVTTAPPGKFLNTTVLRGLVFVIVNLGSSAKVTKAWYQEKFGHEKVDPKFRMIPYIW